MKPVTVVGERMYLGELLEELSKQSGVTITAGDSDGAAGERVAVYLNDVPLGDALNALWSLVSYQKAEWGWEITGDKPEHYAYRLFRPHAARNLSAKTQEEVQKDFERHAMTLLKGIHLKPDERKQFAKRDPVAGALLEGERLRSGLSVFEDSLSDDERFTILRDKKPVSLAVNALSPEGQEFVRSVSTSMKGYHKLRDGTLVPIPEPKNITFKVDRFSGDVSPTLLIDLEGFGGFGYMGGDPLNNQWKAKLKNRWMLPKDSLTDEVENAGLPPLPQLKGHEKESEQSPLFAWLRRSAQAAHFCFLSHLPRDQRAPGNEARTTIGAALDDLGELLPPLQRKWHSGILLLTYPSLLVEDTDSERTPWLVVKRLRAARDLDPQGLLSLNNFIEAARGATPDQWREMGRDAEFAPMADAAKWHDFFLWMNRAQGRDEQILSADGVPLDTAQAPLERHAASDPQIASLLAENKAVRLRLDVQAMPNSGQPEKQEPPRRMFLFTFLSREGKTAYATGFFWEGIADIRALNSESDQMRRAGRGR